MKVDTHLRLRYILEALPTQGVEKIIAVFDASIEGRDIVPLLNALNEQECYVLNECIKARFQETDA